MPVREAVRRAEASLWAAECVASVARWVVSRCPCNDDVVVPLEEELPDPPLTKPKKLPPTLEVLESVLKVLPAFITSLNADVNVALVDVSAVAD
ncbi:MAG: hypothetical protein ACJ8FS_04635 [Sphingomicrobium sp.]